MSIIQGISQTAAGGFDPELIGNSVWMDGSADGFTKPASEFDAEDGKEFTLGTWFQLTEFGVTGALFCAGNGSGTYTSLRHSNDDKIYFQTEAGSHILSTTAVFRDVAWYHVLVSVDTTQATNTNRVKIYINGVEATLTGTYPAENHAYDFNLASVHEVGDSYENGAFEGYLAQSFMIGSKSIQQSDYAITDVLDSFDFSSGSQFGPKKHSEIKTLVDAGSDNSFLLNYENSVLLGQDISNFSETNVARSMTGLKSDDLDVGAVSLLTDGTQFGSWNAGSNLVYQNSNTTTKAWWGVDFGADGVAITKAILYGNQSSDGSTAGFTSTSISNVTFTLFGSDSAQATNNNDLSGLTTVGSVVVSNTQTKGVTATISATSNTTKFRYYYVQMNTTETTRRLLGEIELFTVGNSFLATSMSAANQSNNTPSLNYPTMNPLNNVATVVLSEGNTRVNAQANASIRSTVFADSGKRYAEITVTAIGNSYLGVAVNGTNPTSFAATGAVACQQGGDIYVSSSSPSGNKCPAYTTGDVMGILIDVDADKFWVSKNGTFHSMDRSPTITLTAAQVLAGTGGFDLTALGSGNSYAIHVGNSDGTSANVLVNFGQYTFSHTPPTGYLNWSSENFDSPDAQGVDHFATTLAQEGSLFSAMNTAESAYSATLRIYKSRASASASETWGYSFSHDSSNEYILPAANTAMTYGSIRSLSGTDNWVGYSLDISATAGTAAGSQAHSNGSDTTVTHSLGSSRYIVLLFSRSGGDIFYYHPDLASGSLLKFNSSVLPFSSTVITDITTNSFDIGSAAASATYDYLVLAEKPGVTDIFSYKGNGSTGGPYLSLNAMPEFITFKLTTTHATEHIVLDQTRSPINDADIPYIMPNQLSAEANNTTFLTDFLSGAAKIRNSSTDGNFSGGTFVGWSFGKIAGNGTLPPVYGK